MSDAATWVMRPQPDAAALAPFRHLPPVLATLLAQRGVTAESLDRFTDPLERDLTDPFSLIGMDAAVTAILAAIDDHRRIFIHGDYDCDGVTAQSVLARALVAWGVPAERLVLHLPARRDGYGLSARSIAAIKASGAGLVVTVDCGVNDHDAVRQITRSLGIPVVVTDHHHIEAGIPPDAVAVVNPQRGGGADLTELAGVGVAYTLVRALGRTRFGIPACIEELLALVAVGTVADMVPLGPENRTLVTAGLAAIREGAHPGIAALLRVAGVDPRHASETTIGFDIGPRLNAPGRVRESEGPLAARLVCNPDDAWTAERAARQCDTDNATRKELSARHVGTAREHLRELHGGDLPRVLVVGDPAWMPGTAGLVAGKLTEAYHRPAFAFQEQNGIGKGSARSIPGVSLIEAFAQCGHLFTTRGGHAGAAGFTFPLSQRAAIAAALNEWAATLPPEHFRREVVIDTTLPHAAVSVATARALAALSPCESRAGAANPVPRFLVANVGVTANRTVGGDGAHLAFTAQLAGGGTAKAIGFFLGERARELGGRPIDLVAELAIDRYRGGEKTELRVRDFRPSD